MPYDANGIYARVHRWEEDRDNGIRILANRHDEEDDSIAGALNQAFLRSGVVPMTGPVVMNGNALSQVRAGTALQPGITFELDVDTGFFQPSAGQLGVSVNGVQKGLWTDDGLDVAGNITVNGIEIGGGSGGSIGNDIDIPGHITAGSYLTIQGVSTFTGGVAGPLNVTGDINSPDGLITAGGIASTSAIGGVSLVKGDATHTGYISFVDHNAVGVAGTRRGYIGFIPLAAGSDIGYQNDNGGGHAFAQIIKGYAGAAITGDLQVSATIYTNNVQPNVINIGGPGPYSMYVTGNQDILNFDSNDWMYYDKVGNVWGMNIGGRGAIAINNSLEVDFGGNSIWLNARKMLIQQDGTTAFVRNQSNGSLWLGANAQNFFEVRQNGDCGLSTGSLYSPVNLQAAAVVYARAGAGNGFATLTVGTTGNTGYVAFHQPDAARLGYIGYSTPGGPIGYTSDNNQGHVFVGGPLNQNGNLNVNGGNLNVTGFIYSGKVHAIAAADGNCYDARDQGGNPHQCNLRFTNNEVSATYGRLGYGGDASLTLQNAIGWLNLAAYGGWVCSIHNHQFNADIFQPNCPTTGAGPNAAYASGNNNQRLRSVSSLRYKTNVKDIDTEVAIIDRLRPVSYNSLCEADKPDAVFYGLIAEEVETVDKSIVVYDGENRPDGLNYNAFIPLLIKEIQSLRARVAALGG